MAHGRNRESHDAGELLEPARLSGHRCYAPLSDAASPTLANLMAGWTSTPSDPTSLSVTGNQSLISYFASVATQAGKPLLFTEIGYESASDAAKQPSGTSTNVYDPALQANLYSAFFEAWQQSGNNSLLGVYFWNWDPNAAEVGPGNGPISARRHNLPRLSSRRISARLRRRYRSGLRQYRVVRQSGRAFLAVLICLPAASHDRQRRLFDFRGSELAHGVVDIRHRVDVRNRRHFYNQFRRQHSFAATTMQTITFTDTTNNNTVQTTTAALTVNVLNPPINYTLSVGVSGNGTVSSSPSGIGCPSMCTVNYSSGTPVMLTATPAGGATFNGWGGACSGNGSCLVTMNSIESVTAMFSSSGGGGPSSQTFVSATLGSDANPCTRMSPCLTSPRRWPRPTPARDRRPRSGRLRPGDHRQVGQHLR